MRSRGVGVGNGPGDQSNLSCQREKWGKTDSADIRLNEHAQVANILSEEEINELNADAEDLVKEKFNVNHQVWEIFRARFSTRTIGQVKSSPQLFEKKQSINLDEEMKSKKLNDQVQSTGNINGGKMDEIRIKPSPSVVCTRFECTICGGMTEKTNVQMVFFHPVDGQEQFVCENCIVNGPSAIKETLLKHAAHLRECANELCRLAEATIIVPTSDEIDRAYYETARDRGYSKPFADFVAEYGFEKLKILYEP